MAGQAVGMVETVGFIPAVEAADAAAKGAAVTLQGLHYAGKGLVTVVLFGDISEVKAAVEAAHCAAARLGQVRSTTTLGRPDDSLFALFGGQSEPEADAEQPAKAPAPTAPTPTAVLSDPASLAGLTVAQLRKLARELPGLAIGGQEIKYARKKTLIDLLVAHIKGQQQD